MLYFLFPFFWGRQGQIHSFIHSAQTCWIFWKRRNGIEKKSSSTKSSPSLCWSNARINVNTGAWFPKWSFCNKTSLYPYPQTCLISHPKWSIGTMPWFKLIIKSSFEIGICKLKADTVTNNGHKFRSLFKTLGCKILMGHLPQTWACTYPETMGLWAGRTVEKQRTPGTQATCSLGFDLTIARFLHHQAAQRIWNMTVLVSIQTLWTQW